MGSRTVRREDPADELRCTRTGKGWRCHNERRPGRVYCERHHGLYLARLERTKTTKFDSSSVVKRPRCHPPPCLIETIDDSVRPSPENIASGQIWAVFSPTDGFPRSYVHVESLVPAEDPGAVAAFEVTPLIPADAASPVSSAAVVAAPTSDTGDVPLSCGAFKHCGRSAVTDISAFAHRMIPRLYPNEVSDCGWQDLFMILPRQGEIWAIYHGWDDKCWQFVYRLVEVLTDFGEEGTLTVAALAPVEEELLGRQLFEGFQLLRSFSLAELIRFSHRIPVIRVDTGSGSCRWKLVLHEHMSC